MLKFKILTTAVRLAQRDGLTQLTRDAVAKSAGVALGTVNYHYETIAELRNEVLRRAIETEDMVILMHALAQPKRYPLLRSLPIALRLRVANHLAGK